MTTVKSHNPLAESFLIQLGLDIEGSGLDTLLHNPDISSARTRGVSRVFSNPDCGFTSEGQRLFNTQSAPQAGTTPSTEVDPGLADMSEFHAPAFNNVSLPTRGTSDSFSRKFSEPFYPHQKSTSSTTNFRKEDLEMYGMLPPDIERSPGGSEGPTPFHRQDSSASNTAGASPSNTIQDNPPSTNGPISDSATFYSYSAPMNSQSLPTTANMTWAFGNSSMGPPENTGLTPQGTGMTPQPTSMTPGPSGTTPQAMDLPSPGSSQWTQMMESIAPNFQMPENWDATNVQ